MQHAPIDDPARYRLQKLGMGKIRVRDRDRLEHVEHRADGDSRHKELVELGDELESSLIETERDLINSLYRNVEFLTK